MLQWFTSIPDLVCVRGDGRRFSHLALIPTRRISNSCFLYTCIAGADALYARTGSGTVGRCSCASSRTICTGTRNGTCVCRSCMPAWVASDLSCVPQSSRWGSLRHPRTPSPHSVKPLPRNRGTLQQVSLMSTTRFDSHRAERSNSAAPFTSKVQQGERSQRAGQGQRVPERERTSFQKWSASATTPFWLRRKPLMESSHLRSRPSLTPMRRVHSGSAGLATCMHSGPGCWAGPVPGSHHL